MGKQLHPFSILIAIVLGIEFVFGMIVNLFVSIPSVLLHPQGFEQFLLNLSKTRLYYSYGQISNDR
ncbi:hypothetical protein [Sulfoacidibacillus thermotolerans]|nr:hypothetical protein [Sulfoacidibacillus thermotolerans]